MAEIMDAYWRMPPLTRFVTTAVLATSIGGHFGLIPVQWLYFDYYFIFKLPPQVWRPFTSFLLTGPKLGIVMDTYFVYQYLNQLETAHPKFTRAEDLLWYLFFCGVIILVVAKYFLGSFFFLPALILAMAYTATQDARGQKAGFFFFTVPAQLIPICMMCATLLMSGPHAMLLQLVGLIAAHLHDFLTRLYPEFGGGRNWIPAPDFLSRLVNTPRIVTRNYGTAMQASQSSAGTGAQGSGPLPDSWKTRGAGHRLG
ncbi:DER1-domain-containing protein [Cryphonectria parasitica EP155]|uniref:Derlin n=1 Tax=Cryphonectria parasitica (strain ATCC 38755 / EP155) TaxID=660469 RepID=A0A9P4YCR7_CRYP1|nr:DER1-domain-containing protein [Cryphonectria parasitica EP155]KAF3770666.1 DER1-domain-containing protein [Cryphonectria parasitica EP155]